jgi:hypothetical protein
MNITDEGKIMSKFNREMGLLGFALSACVLVVGALFNFTFQPIDAVRQIFLCRPFLARLIALSTVGARCTAEMS